MTDNDQKAAQIGQDGQVHDVNQLYSAYRDAVGVRTATGDTQAPSTVSPMELNQTPNTKVRGT